MICRKDNTMNKLKQKADKKAIYELTSAIEELLETPVTIFDLRIIKDNLQEIKRLAKR